MFDNSILKIKSAVTSSKVDLSGNVVTLSKLYFQESISCSRRVSINDLRPITINYFDIFTEIKTDMFKHIHLKPDYSLSSHYLNFKNFTFLHITFFKLTNFMSRVVILIYSLK